nr:CHASE3 domain-containing protein [Pseudomonadota bacterium]
MTGSSSRPTRRANGLLALPIGTFIGFALAFLCVVLVAYGSWRSLAERSVAADRVAASLEVITQTQAVLSTIKDAETGQRGFLLTGSEAYLEPYNVARADLAPELKSLRNVVAGNPGQLRRVDELASLSAEKMSDLAETVALARAGNKDAARAIVNNARGKAAMDRIRIAVDDAVRSEQATLAARQLEWQDAVQKSALISGGGSAVLLLLIAAAALTASRDYRAQRTQAWIRSGQLGLAETIAGEQRPEAQADRALSFLANYLHARAGAFYIADDAGGFRRAAGYAFDVSGERRIGAGTDLLAQAAKDGRPLHVTDVPEGYLPVSSA